MISDRQRDYTHILSGLKEQIYQITGNKKRKSETYPMPENISKKAKSVLLDLEEHHDNSFAVEMFLKNIKRLDNITILYRGRQISGLEFWSTVCQYARALKSLGFRKGDEIPVMMANCPEYFYLLVAIDLIGAIMNIVGSWFDEDYLKEIFINSKSKYIFVTDDINQAVIYGIENAGNIERVIMFSLTDSLMKDSNGQPVNPYAEYDEQFGHFHNNVEDLRQVLHKTIVTTGEFIRYSDAYDGQIVEDMILDDPCIITYTSGTTSKGRPKACLHSNRNYLSIARFKRADVAPMPPMKKVTVLAHFPSYIQTVITTAYTDPLYMGWTSILEPYYELKFYPYSLLINKPNYTTETPEYEKYVAKILDTSWKHINMRERIAVCVAGQELSPGLERYLNRIFREHRFGTARLPFPLAPVTVSIAGGTTENGGFLVTLFKSLQEKRPMHFFRKDPMLLQSIGLADIEVLSPDGRRCENYERGMCVANTPTNQIGYVDNEYNKDTEITDEHGKTWRTMATPGYKDRYGCIRMVDRPNTDIVTDSGEVIPLYTILDIVKADTKDIMEAYLAKLRTTDHEKYVIHIEIQPDAKLANDIVLMKTVERLRKTVNPEVLDNLYFRIRTFDEGFPVAGTGKTDILGLENEGISEKCIAFHDIYSFFS